MQYIKKPISIEAVQWLKTGDHPSVQSPYSYDTDLCKHCLKEYKEHGSIDTLEGVHIVCPGDYIIRGVKGELYPCKPDIFEKTYIKDDSIELIKKVLGEMASQSNRATASPYYYTIRDYKKIYGFDSSFDYDGYIWVDEDENTYDKLEDVADSEVTLKKIYYRVVEKHTETFFLTEAAAQRHLELNKHHYTDKAYIYLTHAFRSPEFKQLIHNLMDYFEVEKGNWR